MFNELDKGLDSELILLYSKAKFSLINGQIHEIVIRKKNEKKKGSKSQKKKIPSKKNEIFSALS